MTVTHFTSTGPRAGSLYCGTSREWAAENGDTFAHYVTVPERWLRESPRANGICVQCHAAVTGRIGADVTTSPEDRGEILGFDLEELGHLEQTWRNEQ